jgi:capsule polysaccharide export protein KpsC/LpsZ
VCERDFRRLQGLNSSKSLVVMCGNLRTWRACPERAPGLPFYRPREGPGYTRDREKRKRRKRKIKRGKKF